MYNFGFARSHHLPAINESVLGMVDVRIRIRGNGRETELKGRVIGFSNRLNTILVPESFIVWSNREYAPEDTPETTRLIVQVSNPTDPAVSDYLASQGYELEEDRSQTEKTAYFLKMIIMIVLAIGLVITVLSFYILMLSIYLLVQKNAEKLENLMLIGYSPSRTARPYQLLTLVLNFLVFVLALLVLWFVRCYYMDLVTTLYPEMTSGTLLPAVVAGLLLLLLVSVINVFAIRRKVLSIWKRKE
jgi:cell division protein FtsX